MDHWLLTSFVFVWILLISYWLFSLEWWLASKWKPMKPIAAIIEAIAMMLTTH